MIWGLLIFVVLFCLFTLVYVHEERLYVKQWVSSELWHARLAHLKECHPEMLRDDGSPR